MSGSVSLLDDLTEYLGLDYVSELKIIRPAQKAKCAFFLKDISDTDIYSLHQWNDACSYISHGEIGWSSSTKAAKDNLRQWLIQ